MLKPTHKSAENYRADLDGLRGIAVLAVVAYHLDLPFASGGFVGVDIFFVLSGFLITRLIAAELQRGEFSITRFYERRIRRIIPALVFVCACVSGLAVAFLLPEELRVYAWTLLATALSATNIWFFEHSNYFDPVSASQPLLHTWSLGIEEQFYVVFPLLLMAVYRWWPRWLGAIVWLTFAVSLIASVVLLPEHPLAAFYLLHTRAWELVTGSIAALALVPSPGSRAQSEVAAGLGLVAILTAIFAYASKTPFPGAAALLPCIGTALVIWAGETTGGRPAAVVTRALSSGPLIGLGLISYSLYLWHWPLIVFTKLVTAEPLTPTRQFLIALAAIALACTTWYFVEQPFRRRGSSGFTRGSIFKAGALGLGAMAASAIAVIMFHGLPQRFPLDVLAIAAAQADSSPLRAKCHFQRFDTRTYDDTCVISEDVEPSVIVYGDSHGAELSAVLGELASSRRASIRQITASGCPPAAGFSFPGDRLCEQHNAEIIDRLTSLSPTTIVLASYALSWSREFPDQFWPGIERTITTLRAAGHRVIVLGPVPDMPHAPSIPAAIARWVAAGHDPNDFSFKFDPREFGAVEARLSEIAIAQGAIFVPISGQFCANSVCKPYSNGSVLYFDNNHLSMTGAQLITSRLLVPIIWPEPDISRLNPGLAPY